MFYFLYCRLLMNQLLHLGSESGPMGDISEILTLTCRFICILLLVEFACLTDVVTRARGATFDRLSCSAQGGEGHWAAVAQ